MDNFWKAFTAFISLAVAYIAYQQFRLGREKMKLDLFEKRFAVFAAVRRFLSAIAAEGKCSMEQLSEYRRFVAEASFLFESDITTFIDEIDKHALQLWLIKEKDSATPLGEEKVRLADAWGREMTWLMNQLPELRPKFAPYMKFETWRGGLSAMKAEVGHGMKRCWASSRKSYRRIVGWMKSRSG